MTAENRRMLRMMCKAALLICLPLTGFVWALPEGSSMLTWATLLTLLSIGVGVGAELLAAANETELKSLSARFEADSRRRAEELEQRDEKLRQFERIVSLLTEQNHSLRAKLISVQVGMQRKADMVKPGDGDKNVAADILPAARGATGTHNP